MDVTLGPAPSVVALMPTWDYRVVFWEHQLPPEGSGISPDDMGWAELTFTLSDVQDVHEAIEWAEKQLVANRGPYSESGTPVRDREYVVYAKVPGEDRFLQIAGWNPTNPGADNLRRVGRQS